MKLFIVAALATPGLAAAGPRTLGNGRPACGNVMGKGKRRTTCEPAPATLATAPPPAQPRTLTNGRPACGNVMGKYSSPVTACDADPVSAMLASAPAVVTPKTTTRAAVARKARTRTAKAGAR